MLDEELRSTRLFQTYAENYAGRDRFNVEGLGNIWLTFGFNLNFKRCIR